MFAVTTLFAILLAIATASDAINRDGVWIVESIAVEDWGGSWNGTDPKTGESCGGAVLMYVAEMRDGDRTRFACVGDDMDNSLDLGRHDLPRIGEAFVFSGTQMPVGKPNSPSYFAVDDQTVVVPVQASDGHSPILNVLVVLMVAILAVVFFGLFRRLLTWLPARIIGWLERRRARRDHYRKTHIV